MLPQHNDFGWLFILVMTWWCHCILVSPTHSLQASTKYPVQTSLREKVLTDVSKLLPCFTHPQLNNLLPHSEFTTLTSWQLNSAMWTQSQLSSPAKLKMSAPLRSSQPHPHHTTQPQLHQTAHPLSSTTKHKANKTDAAHHNTGAPSCLCSSSPGSSDPRPQLTPPSLQHPSAVHPLVLLCFFLLQRLQGLSLLYKTVHGLSEKKFNDFAMI